MAQKKETLLRGLIQIREWHGNGENGNTAITAVPR